MSSYTHHEIIRLKSHKSELFIIGKYNDYEVLAAYAVLNQCIFENQDSLLNNYNPILPKTTFYDDIYRYVNLAQQISDAKTKTFWNISAYPKYCSQTTDSTTLLFQFFRDKRSLRNIKKVKEKEKEQNRPKTRRISSVTCLDVPMNEVFDMDVFDASNHLIR